MRTHEHKALCSPQFVRAGVSIVLIAALAITGIAYARSPDDDGVNHQSKGTFDGSASRRSMPNLFDEDSLDLMSVSDPLIVQAEEAIRTAFNIERNKTCASKNHYGVPGAIQYARKEVALNGTVMYTLEVNFDDDVVLARVAMLPNTVGKQFQLNFSIPGPCDDGPQDQLAVSALGTYNHILAATLSMILILNF
jgi:hypothetical protein